MYRLEIKKGSIPAKKAETPPQNGLKLDYIFKLLHFNYLPPLIFVIPISSSVRVLKIAEIDPK